MSSRASEASRGICTSIRPIAWVVLAALLTGCTARAPGPPQSPSTWPADEALIRAAIHGSADAWNRGDLDAHLAIYVDSVTFMTPDGPRPGVAAVRESFSKRYFRDGKPRQTLAFTSLTMRPLGRDAALATGRFSLTGGGESEQSGWFTLVWVRTTDGWRAVHDHTG